MRNFNLEMVRVILDRDKIEISDDQLRGKINRDTRFKFLCACGKETEQALRNMFESGARCKICIKIQAHEKYKLTCLEKFGTESSLGNSAVREKSKATMIERYGVSHPSQSAELHKRLENQMIHKYGVNCLFKLPEVQALAHSDSSDSKKKATNRKNLGCDFPAQSADVQAKRKATSVMRYGVENPAQSAEIKAKIRATLLEAFSVTNISQIADVKQKKIKKSEDRYGCSNISQAEEIKMKKKKTVQEHFGVDYPLQALSVIATARQTILEKYGGHPMQVPEIAEKVFSKLYLRKSFTFPSGLEIQVQGYEPQALTLLVADGYDETTLLTAKADVPKIMYLDDAGGEHRYYVDVYIPTEMRMIEVKSSWTLLLDPEKIEAKRRACVGAGYRYEIWVMDHRGHKARVINDLEPLQQAVEVIAADTAEDVVTVLTEEATSDK